MIRAWAAGTATANPGTRTCCTTMSASPTGVLKCDLGLLSNNFGHPLKCLSPRVNMCPVIVDVVRGLNSSDLLVLLKLAAHRDAPAPVRQLGTELDLSKSLVASSLNKLRELKLVKVDVSGNRRSNQ